MGHGEDMANASTSARREPRPVGAGMRLVDRNPHLIGDPNVNAGADTGFSSNGDDGNLNYNTGIASNASQNTSVLTKPLAICRMSAAPSTVPLKIWNTPRR